MGGGLESRCVGRVCGADGVVLVASSWRFKLFHEEDERSNKPQFGDSCLTTEIWRIKTDTE